MRFRKGATWKIPITRTTGYTQANVVYVDESGYMYSRGILVTCKDAAVIPALVPDLVFYYGVAESGMLLCK